MRTVGRTQYLNGRFFFVFFFHCRLLEGKRKELGDAASKLRNGLSKLIETREKVEAMTIELEGAKVKLAQFQKECDEYLVSIVQQKRDAEEQEKVREGEESRELCVHVCVLHIMAYL